MRHHYLAIAEAILVEAGVQHVVYVNRQIRGYAARAKDKRRYIVTSVPTTGKRLLTLAHEAGHVYFRHGNSVPSYRREYEAEQYSYATLRRFGIEFDEKQSLEAGERYVASKLRMGRGNLKQICRECFLWAQKHLRSSKGGREVLARVKAGEIKLVSLKRPDPTLPPKKRTRTLELTVYEPKAWDANSSSLPGVTRGCTKRYRPSWTPELRVPESSARKPLRDNNSVAFVDILRTAMAESGESIPEISRGTGIAHPVLYRIKNGVRNNVRLDVAETLARYLGYTLLPIVGGKKN